MVGASTAFAFMNCALVIKPDWRILNRSFLPFAVVPLFMNASEMYLYQEQADANISNFIHILSKIGKESHISGIVTGLLMGIFFRYKLL